MNIGLAIKSLRGKAGMSQMDLSKKTGLSQASISQIEQGQKEPHKKTVEKIAKALGVTHTILVVAAVEREDVKQDKQILYDKLMPVIKSLIDQLVEEATPKRKKSPPKKLAKKRQ